MIICLLSALKSFWWWWWVSWDYNVSSAPFSFEIWVSDLRHWFQRSSLSFWHWPDWTRSGSRSRAWQQDFSYSFTEMRKVLNSWSIMTFSMAILAIPDLASMSNPHMIIQISLEWVLKVWKFLLYWTHLNFRSPRTIFLLWWSWENCAGLGWLVLILDLSILIRMIVMKEPYSSRMVGHWSSSWASASPSGWYHTS